jgi:hypothetical protein
MSGQRLAFCTEPAQIDDAANTGVASGCWEAHGSKDPCWRTPFERIVEAMQGQSGKTKVRLAYMECARSQVWPKCGKVGWRRNGCLLMDYLK